MKESERSTWVTVPLASAESLQRRRCELQVTAGPDAKRTFEIEGDAVRVGSQKTCDLVLTDPTVSAVHFELRLDERGYCLIDLGSKNGVLVDGCRILKGYIPPGAQLKVGTTTLKLKTSRDVETVPISNDARFGPLVGASLPMRELFERLQKIAATELTVLISGETGVGKEVVAQAIVENGPRRDKPLLVFDCGAIPSGLVESELFGHERGAFSGATRNRTGLFELAHGGTLLLDEIGELPLELQPKLLRTLATGEVRPVGSDEVRKLDVRILAATNRQLDVEVSRGCFREDLYYRLAVAQVRVPALRERPDDVPLLARTFCAELGADADAIVDQLARWKAYDWPGNVRELRHTVSRHVAGAGSEPVALPERPDGGKHDLSVPFKEAKAKLITDFERSYLRALMDEHQGNVSRAARAAGIDRITLYKLISRCRLDG